MAALTGLAILGGAAALNKFAGERADANARVAQGEYQYRLAQWNAHIAEEQATDAIARGNVEAARVSLRTRTTVAAQRAAAAGSGVDVSSGSAADLQRDSVYLGAIDEATARNNAAREAWGYRVQAWDARNQGELARMGARNTARAERQQSFSTLLTGGSEIVGLYRTAGK